MPAQSTGVLREKEANEQVAQFAPSAEMQAAMRFYASRFNDARTARETPCEYFDDMSYEMDYRKNRQAVNSYLKKKRNDDEVRVVTGTTEKKTETIVNELVAMNLRPQIFAHDEHDMALSDLASDFTDIVERTDETERADEVMYEAFLELVTQRAVFMEEVYDERTVVAGARRTKGKKLSMGTTRHPRKQLISGLKVFLGDITIPARLFHTQPFIFTVDVMTYEEARSLYEKENPEMWKYVKQGTGATSWGEDASQYRVSVLSENEVEVVKYYSALDNEYNVFVNMIPMKEVGSPLPYEHDGYCIEMVVPKPMWTDFAYGRSPVVGAKFMQSLEDESIRSIIRKFRQALEPPLGVRGNKVYSRNIFNSGAITNGVMKDDIFKLVDHNGVTSSEFEVMSFINKKAEEFIGRSELSQGLTPDKRMTATQVLETQKQAAKQLGLITFAAIKLVRAMTYQRIYTIVEKMSSPVGMKKNPYTHELEEVYRRFTLSDAALGEGKRGEKIIQFSNRDLTDEEQNALYEEERRQERRGRFVRVRNVNIERVREITILWYVVVEPRERKGSMLQQVTFQDQMMQAVTIEKLSAGQKRINWDSMAEDYERIWQRKDTFLKEAPQSEMMMPGAMGAGGGLENAPPEMRQLLGEIESMEGSQVGSQAASGARQGASRPSVNTLLQQ